MAVGRARRLRRDRRRRRPQRARRPRRTCPGRPADARPRAARPRRRRGDTTELAPGSACRPLAHTVGRLRPSVVRDLELAAPRAVAGRRRTSGSSRRQPDGSAITLWARRRRGPPTGCARGRPTTPSATPDFDRLVRSLGGLPRRPRRSGRRRTSKSPGLGDALAGLKLGRRSAASAATTAGRSCGCCRWPSPTSSPSRSRPTRSGPRSPGAASATRAMGPWSAGTAAVLLADSAGNDGGAAGQTVFARGGPGALSEALARRPRARRRRDPDRRRGRRDHVDGTAGRPASCSPSGEEIAARAVVVGHRPEADADDARRSGRPRPDACAGGRATSGRPARWPRSTSRWRRCPGSPRPATTTSLLRGRILVAPGIDAMERASTPRSTAGWRRPDPRGDDPVARRPSLVEGAQAGHARHERHRPVRAVRAARRRLGRAARGARRSGRRELDAVAPGLGGSRHRPAGDHAARPRARLRPDRRPPAPRRARPRPVLPLAAAARPRPVPPRRSRGCTWPAPAPTRAAASPADRARTRAARSSPTCGADGASRSPGRGRPGFASQEPRGSRPALRVRASGSPHR